MTVHDFASSLAAPARRLKLRLATVTLALLVLVVHHRTLAELWTVWRTNDNYSHGPLVPIAALGLVFMRRASLARLVVRPSAWGLLLTGLACLLQIVGLRADVFALQGYAFVLLLVALVQAFLGTAFVRALAFPLGFLIFMLTFPPFLVNQLSFALKEITVRASTGLAELVGVTVQRSGMSLYLASGELRIENPCSGLRSLMALLATGALFAYLQPGAWPRRVAMFLAAIPIAMLGNVLRTTLLIVVGHYQDVETAGGALHDLSGYLVYGVALGGMLLLRHLLIPRKRPAEAAV